MVTAKDFLREARERQADLEGAKARVKKAWEEEQIHSKARLNAEAHRREVEQQIEQARNGALVAVLTADVVDVLAPDHSGNCADGDTHNDDGSCARCTLLQALTSGYLDGKWTFTMEPMT